MKRILLLLTVMMLLSSCGSPEYTVISDHPVDGFYIYQKDNDGLFCNQYYQAVFYSGPVYNYGYQFQACSPGMTHFVKVGGNYVFVQEALNNGTITYESLLPELETLVREPEEFSSQEADYYWLDFHISGEVVYAYAGGQCEQEGHEEFIIDGVTYFYSASGCLKDHILYMQKDGDYVPVQDLLDQNVIDSELLLPLLTIQESE